MADGEPECAEQREARELAARLRAEMLVLRDMQARGVGPPANDPVQGMLESEFVRRLAALDLEASRPASRRLPVDAAPPREVLRAANTVQLLFDPPAGHDGLCNVTRYIEDDSVGQMGLGFNIRVTKEPFSTEHTNAMVARLPWRQEMGTWTPLQWAWLLALVLKKVPLRCGVSTVVPSYKLQASPRPGFREALREAFGDVCRTARMAPHSAPFAAAEFAVGPVDLDKQNDLALFFDTQLWRVAADLGFELEDRSEAPAMIYHIGPADSPVDKNGKRWGSAEAYVRGRLGSAGRHASLSEADAAQHVEYLWELLRSQTLRVAPGPDNVPMADLWVAYKDFTERRLGKSLRAVARQYGRAAPAEAAAQVGRRCAACGAAEGTKPGCAPGARLRCCACNPGGEPRYCDIACQRADWAEHKEFCTARPDDAKKKGKGAKPSK
jgi:hypothetical protein